MSHPSDQQVRQWLDTGVPRELDAHIGACDQCTALADRLSTETIADRFRRFLAPPDDFEGRIAWRVEMALSRWEALEVMAGMFSIGLQTAGLMIGDGPDE